MLKNKLLKIERTVNVYHAPDSLIKEIPIEVSIDTLKKIIPSHDMDPEYYDGYVLSEEELMKLIPFLKEEIKPAFQKYSYILEATGIYDW